MPYTRLALVYFSLTQSASVDSDGSPVSLEGDAILARRDGGKKNRTTSQSLIHDRQKHNVSFAPMDEGPDRGTSRMRSPPIELSRGAISNDPRQKNAGSGRYLTAENGSEYSDPMVVHQGSFGSWANSVLESKAKTRRSLIKRRPVFLALSVSLLLFCLYTFIGRSDVVREDGEVYSHPNPPTHAHASEVLYNSQKSEEVQEALEAEKVRHDFTHTQLLGRVSELENRVMRVEAAERELKDSLEALTKNQHVHLPAQLPEQNAVLVESAVNGLAMEPSAILSAPITEIPAESVHNGTPSEHENQHLESGVLPEALPLSSGQMQAGVVGVGQHQSEAHSYGSEGRNPDSSYISKSYFPKSHIP